MQSRNIVTIIAFVCALFLQGTGIILAQTASQSAQTDLQNQIKELEAKIADLQGQGRTLSSQISVMDSQARLTEFRIRQTQSQIASLQIDIDTAGTKIASLEAHVDTITRSLLGRIVATYQFGDQDALSVLVASSNANDFSKRLQYLRLVQQHDKRLVYDTVQARNDYTNQKNILEDKRKRLNALKSQLEQYTKELAAQKKQKQSLLAETQGSEARYQALLADARAQLAGFSAFATSQGGSNILPPQASPDGWFFSQRDERWGRLRIGVSNMAVWEVGCLLTSIAMVLKQSGENVTPAIIAGRAEYYFSDTAYMLIPWAKGKIVSVWGNSLSAIDAKLASGKPVIVGVRAGPYGTHFVVLKSGSNGNYMMNDPWHGYNLPFSSYYSTGVIFQYGYLP
jgi:peptidoglycan hydrolase CwlO-like protein